MALVELVMPKMGESIMEATILKWLKQPGDTIEEDESVLEIATDKVDSEVPSPVAGVLKEILFPENEVVEIDKVIAIIATEGEESASSDNGASAASKIETEIEQKVEEVANVATPQPVVASSNGSNTNGSSNRFYSPLVMNMARAEGILMDELETVAGSGKDGRVTKKDMKAYIANRSSNGVQVVAKPQPQTSTPLPAPKKIATPTYDHGNNVEIIEMDRMRKLIADHMVMSVQTSPHVTSFVEADVTDMVMWRKANKNDFWKREGTKITFTPIIVEAIAKAIKDFPRINSSVDGYNVIQKKNINIGIAAALPSGNLIVPVVKNADTLNLTGLAHTINGLVDKARNGKLSPSDIQDGTFTMSNVGTFGNVMGTPIINQPQVAIMAAGAIRKMPAVVETEYGDVIAVRHKMFLSLSYDHRIVDGMLGGTFLRRVADYLEQFDKNMKI